MSDENKKYVPEGVFLVCDMGATPSQLIATPRKVNLYGPMIGTEADNKFTLNVLPFGACKTLGGPCTFACVEWTKTKSGNVFANGEKPLLEDSEAICTVGSGKIKIFFDKYEADLANENNNESGFVSEEISSNILGQALTFPFGNLVDLFSDDDEKFTEGVGRGFKKGMESTWNFLTDDMWKADTWKGLGKMAAIGAAYSGPTGMIMGDSTLRSMDATFGTDFIPTRDALVEGVSNAASNAWQDVERGNTGEVGESVGQIYYAVIEAVVGTKGAGLVVKGLSTGAKALIGVERLALLSAKLTKFANALKGGILKIVKVGKKMPKPSELARAWQGNDVYTGIDKWRDIALKKGQKVVGGLPGQSEYYTTFNGFNRSKGITDDLWNGLQVKPHPKFGYRKQVGIYEVVDDTPAAFGTTKANPQFGNGGLPQVFVPEYKNLKLIETIDLK